MLENLSNIIVLIASGVGAILAALLGGLAIWTFRDIRSRSRDILVQILATIVVAVIPLAGILVYLMLRPRETLQEQYVRALEEESLLSTIDDQEFCPSCGRRVDGDMRFCPGCHSKLRNECPQCNRAVHLSWDLCPYCGSGLQSEMPQIKHVSPKPQPVAAPKPVPQVRAAKPQAPAPRSLPPEADATRAPARRAEVVVDEDDTIRTVKAAEGAGTPIGNMLDKLGGAVENLINRTNDPAPRKPKTPERDE